MDEPCNEIYMFDQGNPVTLAEFHKKQIISEIFGVGREKIKYSGSKDKVAITIQYISVENLQKNYQKNMEI
jgi:tRNA(Glu) U13 pseudouridine synthase TruD